MIVAGLDVGSKNIQAVLFADNEVLARVSVLSGFDYVDSAEYALRELTDAAQKTRADVDFIAATGVGRKALPFATSQLTEVAADANGALSLCPQARTVIDVGADEARAIRLASDGKVLDFAINEKCAAGTGVFVEAMSRALDMDLDAFAQASLQSTQTISMNAQCTVFAESEVVSLIHANVSVADIARAVHDAMATRVAALVRRLGIEEPVALGGGISLNAGFVKALTLALGVESLYALNNGEYLGAYGVAIDARKANLGI